MERFQAEGSVFLAREPGEVFGFLCDPAVDAAELTPMEDRVVAGQGTKGVGSTTRTTVELAARELDVVSRCVEFEPGQKLALGLEGDLQGSQVWQMAAEGDGTRLHLALDIERPAWTPAYLQEEQAAQNWAQMLVDQTLENVRRALM